MELEEPQSADYRRGGITVAAIGIGACIVGAMLSAALGGNGFLVPIGALAGTALEDWRQLRKIRKTESKP